SLRMRLKGRDSGWAVESENPNVEEEPPLPDSLSSEAKALIDRPNFAHLATLMADGSPQSVPVWVGREGDRLLVCTSEESLKGRNTRRDPPGWPCRSWISTIIGVTSPRRWCRQPGGEATPDWRAFRGSDLDPA